MRVWRSVATMKIFENTWSKKNQLLEWITPEDVTYHLFPEQINPNGDEHQMIGARKWALGNH